MGPGMPFDLEIQRCTRQCAATQRKLAPGEEFFSVLELQGADVVRSDYCLDAWQGPPEHAVGWWKSRMPHHHDTRARWAPNDVMLHLLEELGQDEGQRDMRYVLALLLIRRKVVKLQSTATDESGNEQLHVYCRKTETSYEVPVLTPSTERSEEIQQELSRLLFADAE